MEENLLLEETNLVRKDPKSFADKLLGCKKYFTGNILRYPGVSPVETSEGFSAFEEAANFLKKMNPLPELILSKGLTKIAKDFAEEISHTEPEKIGDIDLKSIIKKYGSYSGNCTSAMDFGNSTPETTIINLFVSDGDETRGNRDFLIDKNLLKIGICSGKHDTYGYLTVIVSCEKFENYIESDNYDYKESNFKCEICKTNATNICFNCIQYLCDSCFKFVHDKTINSNHKKELIIPDIPIYLKCTLHPGNLLSLFCVNEKSKYKNNII